MINAYVFKLSYNLFSYYLNIILLCNFKINVFGERISNTFYLSYGLEYEDQTDINEKGT